MKWALLSVQNFIICLMEIKYYYIKYNILVIIMSKNPISIFVDYLFSINPYELSLLANILGIILTIPLNANQQNTLGNFFELIGQQILTIQAQNANLSPNQSSNIDINSLLQQINFKFEYLEDMIQYIKNKNNLNS